MTDAEKVAAMVKAADAALTEAMAQRDECAEGSTERCVWSQACALISGIVETRAPVTYQNGLDAVASLAAKLNQPPWLSTIGLGRDGGDPAIRVYTQGKVPKGAIPEVHDGVRVLVRHTGPVRPA